MSSQTQATTFSKKKEFWEKNPCGAGDVASVEPGDLEFFEAVERMRYEGDEFMFDVVGFDQWRDKKVLEVGCGLGTDLLQFARGGADVHGVDLTERGVTLTRKRFALYGMKGSIQVANAQNLPFPDNHFDLVYSWGVIHHTPDPGAAAREIVRVCKPQGRIIVMVYHRRSLLALQAWLLYGLLRCKPWRSPAGIIAQHVQSPGTKIYSPEEALAMFKGLKNAQAQTILTRYDLRIGRRLFLPRWLRKVIPSRWGWFLVVKGTKAAQA